jgi:hypothetical protein
MSGCTDCETKNIAEDCTLLVALVLEETFRIQIRVHAAWSPSAALGTHADADSL